MIDKTDLDEFLDDFFIKERKIFLWGELNTETSLRTIQLLKFLNSKNKKPIILYINSSGGEVEDGLSIIDEINGIKKEGTEIWVVAQGQACSMAAFILVAGTYSYATENTTIMLHPMWGDTAEENNNKLKRSVDFYDKKEELLIKLVAKKSGKTTPSKFKVLKEEIDKTLWLSAEQAKKHGIIDDIWQYEWEKEAKAHTD